VSQRLFKFSVENLSSGESADFIGQGETVLEALSEGVKNVNATWRPSSSGKKTGSHDLMVRTKDGQVVRRSMQEFESKQREAAPVPASIPEGTGSSPASALNEGDIDL
jgi:hypothetical protein